jgi:hypothetical protein
MDKIDLRPFLRQKVKEWKKATQMNPQLKFIEDVGREMLGVYLSERQRGDCLASKILNQLDSMGKRNRMEKYISQMSKEERRYISLIGILEEFGPAHIEG